MAVVILHAGTTRADNWSAWRGDGTGVSEETGLPSEWDAAANITWKTEIGGKGHSSPVVWDEHIFLTTVEEGTAATLVQQIGFVGLWGLTLLVLWWLVEGDLRHPLGRQDPALRPKPLRKAILVVVFVVVAYGSFAAAEEARQIIPGPMHRLFDKPWLYDATKDEQGAVYEIRPVLWHPWRVSASHAGAKDGKKIPFECLLCGVAAAFAVLSVNSLMYRNAYEQQAPANGTGRLASFISWLEAAFVVAIVGTFLIALHTLLMADVAFRPEHIWFRTAAIGCLGLTAAIGAYRARSFGRLLAFLAALVFVCIVIAEMPSNGELNLKERVRASLMNGSSFPFLLALMVAACVWFGGQFFWARFRATDPDAPRGRRLFQIIGPTGILLIVFGYFASSGYLLPNSQLLRKVIAVNRATGRIEWEKTCASGVTQTHHTKNSLATPTAVTDGEHVYARFSETGTFCLDFQGRIVWKNTDFIKATGWSEGSSPILWNDLLILTHNTNDQCFSLALDKKSGKTRWKADRMEDIKYAELLTAGVAPDAYSTPIVAQLAGRLQMIVTCNKAAFGYDLQTGQELWYFKNAGDQVVPSPVAARDLLVVCGGAHGGPYLGVLRLGCDESQRVNTELLWDDTRRIADISSPVLYRDYLFAATGTGVATCSDPTTGRVLWKTRIPAGCHASVVAGDGKVYFVGLHGETIVIEAAPELRILSRNKLDERVVASPAISDGQLFLRGDRSLYCIGSRCETNRLKHLAETRSN